MQIVGRRLFENAVSLQRAVLFLAQADYFAQEVLGVLAQQWRGGVEAAGSEGQVELAAVSGVGADLWVAPASGNVGGVAVADPGKGRAGH